MLLNPAQGTHEGVASPSVTRPPVQDGSGPVADLAESGGSGNRYGPPVAPDDREASSDEPHDRLWDDAEAESSHAS